MFQLNREDAAILKCQFGTSSWGGRRTLRDNNKFKFASCYVLNYLKTKAMDVH